MRGSGPLVAPAPVAPVVSSARSCGSSDGSIAANCAGEKPARGGAVGLGFAEGHNIGINFLSAEGRYDRFPALAAECVRRDPVIIVAYTTPGSLAAKKATSTIPIVTGPIGDPVGSGIVASLARWGQYHRAIDNGGRSQR